MFFLSRPANAALLMNWKSSFVWLNCWICAEENAFNCAAVINAALSSVNASMLLTVNAANDLGVIAEMVALPKPTTPSSDKFFTKFVVKVLA